MFDLKVNNTTIPLRKGTSIPISMVNPMFDNGVGCHSLNFDVYLTDLTKKALGWPNRIQFNSNKKFEFDLYNNSRKIYNGTWFTASVRDNVAEGYLAINSGKFYNEIQNKLLSDIEFPTYSIAAANFLDFVYDCMTKTFPDAEYCFTPVYNPKFYYELYKDMFDDGAIVYPEQVFQNVWEVYDQEPLFRSIYNGPVSPFLYAGKVFELIFEKAGFSVSENIFRTDPWLKKMIIYNNFDIGPQSGLNTDTTVEHYWWNPQQLMPTITVSELISEFEKMGFIFLYHPYKKEIKIKHFNSYYNINNLQNIQNRLYGNFEIQNTDQESGYKFKWADAWEEYWEDRISDISNSDFVIADPVNDYADLPGTDDINTIRYVINYDEYWYMKITDIETGTKEYIFLSDNFQAKIVEDGDNEIEFNFTPVLVEKKVILNNYIYPTEDFAVFPTVYCEGWSYTTLPLREKPECGLKLFFYQGYGETTEGYDYPLALSDNFKKFNSAGGSYSFSESLKFDNLWTRYLEKFYSWKNASNIKVKTLIKLDALFLSNFDFSQTLSCESGNFIVYSLDYEIFHDHISLGEIVLIPI